MCVWGGGGGADEDELSESVGGTFGGLPPLAQPPSKGLLDCTHSTAHNFKRSANE